MIYFVKKKLCLMLAHKCRAIYCILNSPKDNSYIWTRHIVSAVVGLCVATFLWGMLLLNTHASVGIEIIILVTLVVLIVLGFLCTSSLQCISFLIIAGMAGKSGRCYLRALFFSYIISGPIVNLAENGEEVVRIFACATTLTYNLTNTRLDLMTKPFQKALVAMANDVSDVEKSFEKMRPVLQPITDQVEGNDNDSNILLYWHEHETPEGYLQRTYIKKFETRCKNQFKKGELRCRTAFVIAYEECTSQFPLIVRTMLCWPFQASFICGINLIGSPSDICKPKAILPKDFGDSYFLLKDTQNHLNRSDSKIEVKYEANSTLIAAQRSAEHTADSVIKKINEQRKIFKTLTSFLQMLLSFLFFKVILDSIIYCARYLNEIDFDNLYLTDYFRQIDDRRKRVNKLTILPLKKFENKKLVNMTRAFQHTEEESRIIIFHFINFSLETLAACFFLMLDYLIFILLDIIRLKSFISYVQDGEHILNFQMLFRVLVNTNSSCFLKNKLGTYEAENRVNLKMKANYKIKGTEDVERTRYKTYSSQDRERIVNASNRGEDWPALAASLGIAYKTAYTWAISGRPEKMIAGGRKPCKLEAEQIQEMLHWIERNCSITLRQIQAEIYNKFNKSISVSTINNYLEGKMFTLKKVHTHSITMNSPQNKAKRAQYIAQLNTYVQAGKQLIYLDETNFNLFCRQSRGRSKRGDRAVQELPASRGPNVHLIGAISASSVITFDRQRGSFTAASFRRWIATVLEKWQDLGNNLSDIRALKQPYIKHPTDRQVF